MVRRRGIDVPVDWKALGFAIAKAAAGFTPVGGLSNAVGVVETATDLLRGGNEEAFAAVVGARIKKLSPSAGDNPATTEAVNEVASFFKSLDRGQAFVRIALGEDSFRAWLAPRARHHKQIYVSKEASDAYDDVLKAATVEYLKCASGADEYLRTLITENVRSNQDLKMMLIAHLEEVRADKRKDAAAAADLLDLDTRHGQNVLEGKLPQDPAKTRGGVATVGSFADLSRLSIHETIPSAIAERSRALTPYVERSHDRVLRDAVAAAAANPGRPRLLVTTGSSAVGKTRAGYEAVKTNETMHNWTFEVPVTMRGLERLLSRVTDRTVVWLDELQSFLPRS